MSIPNNELFESFLSKTKLVKHIPAGPFVGVLLGDVPNVQSDVTLLYLSYPAMELKLDSVLHKIESELVSLGYSSNQEIALATLVIIVETKDPEIPLVTHANQCLSLVKKAKLHMQVVAPNIPEPGYRWQIAEFVFRAFNPKKILYWADRGGSNYPVDIMQYRDCIALERTPFFTKIIDWDKVPGFYGFFEKWGEEITIRVLDNYYNAVFGDHLDEIPHLIKERLLILESGALVYVDIKSFINKLLSKQIGLFQWQTSRKPRSWALLRVPRFEMNFGPPELFSDCEEWLGKKLGFKELSDEKQLDRSIKSYCTFLQRAHTHRHSGRTDEAFLHFIFAIDLLFGTERRSTKSICLRVSTLVYRQLENDFKEQVNIVKRLYDRRSKYVHKGKSADKNDIEEAEKVCIEVLWCLLAVSGSGKVDDLSSWLKQLDFVSGGIEASKSISDSDIQSLGIPALGSKRIAPNRVLSEFIRELKSLSNRN